MIFSMLPSLILLLAAVGVAAEDSTEVREPKMIKTPVFEMEREIEKVTED